jgi:hypothetical protein
MEARRLILKNPGVMSESSLRRADGLLVVVRSALPQPLRAAYDTYCERKEDAERQLNIAGPNFHVYVYRLNEDLSVQQIRHESYPADKARLPVAMLNQEELRGIIDAIEITDKDGLSGRLRSGR